MSATREGRGRLTLSGPGDPTGHGLGLSFCWDERKVRPLGGCQFTLSWSLLQAQTPAEHVSDGSLLGCMLPTRLVSLQSMLEGASTRKKDAGQITGTSADLRKLSMKESQRILKEYGVTESEIKGAGHLLMSFLHNHSKCKSQGRSHLNGSVLA